MAERLRSLSSGGRFKGCVSTDGFLRRAIEEAECFLPECCSRCRRDFVGEREEDLMGELDEGFLMEGRGEALVFSLVSGSDFFLGEDLVKKLFMDDGGTSGAG